VNEALPNPVGTDSGQEYVEIVNAGLGAIDLTGWSLTTGATTPTVRHRFPSGFVLPGTSVTVVYDTGSHTGTPGAVTSTSGALGLLNSNGTVSLRDATGAAADTFAWGSTIEGVSKNRNPDATVGAPVVDHTAVAGGSGMRSPGLHADQTPYLAFGSLSTPLPTPPAPHELVISQFATRGLLSASDDFVELYNNSGHTLDLSSLRLQSESTSCAGWYNRHVVPQGVLLAPGQFYLVVNATGYLPPASGPTGNGTLTAGLPDSGQLRVVNPVGAELDRVAYGAGLSCTGEGGTIAPNHGTLANGNSVVRKPGNYSPSTPCQDEDNNAADFSVRVGRTPRNTSTPPQRSH
jgi:hypothetical protein